MFALQALVVIVIAAGVGLGSAWLVIDRQIAFEAVQSGSWTAWPYASEAGSDPYVRAGMVTSGFVPLNIAEGLAFTARLDSAGRPIRADCTYVVSGRMPAARWWTLAAYRDEDFTLMDNPAQRYGFDSTEALRRQDGTLEVIVSPLVQAGNWLPSDGAAGELRYMLRLYDTPLSIGGTVGDAELPTIERRGCP